MELHSYLTIGDYLISLIFNRTTGDKKFRDSRRISECGLAFIFGAGSSHADILVLLRNQIILRGQTRIQTKFSIRT